MRQFVSHRDLSDTRYGPPGPAQQGRAFPPIACRSGDNGSCLHGPAIAPRRRGGRVGHDLVVVRADPRTLRPRRLRAGFLTQAALHGTDVEIGENPAADLPGD